MADELDLNVGDPSRGDAEGERRRRRRERSSERSSSQPTASVTDVRGAVSTVLDGWQKNRELREDEELATALAEEKESMTTGFVTLTKLLPVIAMPIVVLCTVAATALAFGRVGIILWNRAMERRARRMAERAMAQGEVPDGYTVNGAGDVVPIMEQ